MSMSDRDGVIWFDGKLVPWRDANVHVLTHSLHYGMGVFEGIRAYKTQNGTAIFRLKEHVKRLFNGLKIFQMKIPFTEEQIAQAITQVVRDNKLASCYIRPIIFIGSQKLGISPTGNSVHTAIAAWEWGAYLGEDGLNKGIRVKTSSFTRHFVNSSLVEQRLRGITLTLFLRIKKLLLMDMMRHYFWIPRDMYPRVLVKICLWSAMALFSLLTLHRVSMALPVIRLSKLRRTWASKFVRNALPETRCIQQMKPSLQEPLPR